MRAYVKIIAAMLIWVTLPLFVNALPYSSAEIVLGRTALGFLCLLLVFLARRRPLQRRALKQYGLRLLLTGKPGDEPPDKVQALLKQVNTNRNLQEKICRADQSVSRRFGGSASFYAGKDD